MALSDRDRMVLEFERLRWKYQGVKDAAVLELFGMSSTRYAQVVQWVIEQPDALVYDPALVGRLRRLRDARRRDRRSRRRDRRSRAMGYDTNE